MVKFYEHKKKSGFTLIELSLSLVFISILALAIALIISNAVASYRRGLTLNQINTAGMDIVDDMRAAIQGSSPREPKVENCVASLGEDCAKKEDLVSVVKTGSIGGMDNIPIAGAFCTGKYSYVWNSGYAFINKDEKKFIDLRTYENIDDYRDNKTSRNYDSPRLMKMADSLRSACVLFSETQEHFDVIGGTEKPVELISSNNADGDLAIYDLSATFSTSGVSINSAFYSVSFILGTVQGGINIKAAGNFCNPPNGYDSNFDYCAINKFNFAAQATGE